MKGKLGVMLFGLPFFAVGVWMAYSIGSNLLDARQMRQWEPVQATLLEAGYTTHSGSDSTTEEAYARYTYAFGGQQYTASRVMIAGGADNIGDYQTDLGNRLSGLLQRRESVTVYVDTSDPSSAIVDRSVRWGLLGFKSIFLIVFGGVGLGLIIFAWRTDSSKDKSAPAYVQEPWLVNADWQSATIKSSSRSTMFFAWIFAAIWNLISMPLPFLVYAEVTQKDNLPALFGLLFPVIGVGVLGYAIRRTLEWRRFGAAPVALDPFPGSIGGHVGGTIDVNLPFDANNHFSMTLTNLRSYISGSGNDRSRRESAQWQDTQVAHMTMSGRGSRLSFRFDVPTNIKESDAAPEDDEYFIWRLNVKADLPGTDINRDYEIPVYATGQESLRLSDFSIEQAKNKQKRLDAAEIDGVFELRQGAQGTALYLPMGRNVSGGIFGVLLGSIFAGVGGFLQVSGNAPIMGAIFAFVGLVAILSAFYCVLNSLEVVKSAGELKSVRRVLGMAVKRRTMRLADFVRFDKKKTSTSQSGSKHVVYYSVAALDRHGERMVIGEGFKGVGQADVAAEFIAQTFGLVSKERTTSDPKPEVEQYNFLTVD